MSRENIIRRAMERANAFGTFYGFNRELRQEVAEVSTEAYLSRRNINASEGEIRQAVNSRCNAMDAMTGRYMVQGC